MSVTIDRTAYTYDNPRLDVTDFAWDAVGVQGDPRTKLITTLRIAGVPHHLEAYQVRYRETEPCVSPGLAREDGHVEPGAEQIAVAEFTDDFDELSATFAGDGAFATVEIEGRDYCLFLSPFRG